MKKFFFTLFFAAFTCSYSIAERIDWETITRQTNEKNPNIQMAKLRFENAKQAYIRALSGYMPGISFRGNASQSENDGIFSRNYSYGLNASLSIFSGFDTYNDVRQKSAELKAAQASYDRTVSDAAYESASQYVNLMWAYETVELSEKILERRAENKDMIKLKYDSGNVDLGSLKRVEADEELSAYDLRKAKRYIETVSAALLKAIGRKDDVLLETDEKLTLNERNLIVPEYNSLIVSIPEFLSAQYNIESCEAQSLRAKSAWWPTISLTGSFGRSGNKWSPDRNSWDSGLSISYPLFTGGTRIADVKIAENQLKIAKENLNSVNNSLKSAAMAYHNGLADAMENIVIREHYLSAAQQQAEISQRKYVNGLSTYQDWYSIENDYINSQKTLLDAKKTAALEKAKWHNFIGEGFVHPGK
ncbi:MAG: TolC family protein [Endomicrobium sp.]|jgi:outer membrane protein TolC|nr:TolC family protein [Endomicrobium sp.]